MSHLALSQILFEFLCILIYPISKALCNKKQVGVRSYNAKMIRLLKFEPEHQDSWVILKNLLPDRSFLFLYFLFLGLFLLFYWNFYTLPPLQKMLCLCQGSKGNGLLEKTERQFKPPFCSRGIYKTQRVWHVDPPGLQNRRLEKKSGDNFYCNIWTRGLEIALFDFRLLLLQMLMLMLLQCGALFSTIYTRFTGYVPLVMTIVNYFLLATFVKI